MQSSMDMPNPLAGGRKESLDIGPDLEPTGKSRPAYGTSDWMEERRGFDSYLQARGVGGMGDTAGSRMQAKQVREMEKTLGSGKGGVDPNFNLADIDASGARLLRLRRFLQPRLITRTPFILSFELTVRCIADLRSAAIVEAWKQEEDDDFGCPTSLALLPNLACLTMILGLFFALTFVTAYESTPKITDIQLEKDAIAKYRDSMQNGERDSALDPEPEPEEGEPVAGSAVIFMGLSILFLVISLWALLTGEDDGGPRQAAAAPPPQPQYAAPQQQQEQQQQQVALPAQSDAELEAQKLDLLFDMKKKAAAEAAARPPQQQQPVRQPQLQPEPAPEGRYPQQQPEPEPAAGDPYADDEEDFC